MRVVVVVVVVVVVLPLLLNGYFLNEPASDSSSLSPPSPSVLAENLKAWGFYGTVVFPCQPSITIKALTWT